MSVSGGKGYSFRVVGAFRVLRSLWFQCFGVALLATLAVSASGAAIGDAFAVLAFLLLTAVCLGRCWARLEPASLSSERLGAGLVLGQLLVIAVSQLGRGWLSASLQLAAAAALLMVAAVIGAPILSDRARGSRRVGLLGLAVLPALVGIALYWRLHPLDFARPTTFFVDTPHLEAMSRGIALLGYGDSIFIAGDPTRYHWFVYGWLGALDSWFSADPFVVQTRISPIVAVVGAILIAPSLVRTVSARPSAPLLAVAMLVSSTVFFRSDIGHHLSEVSPSNSIALSWLLLATVVFLRRVSEAKIGLLQGVVLFVLSFATTGGKVSHGVVLAGGVGVYLLVAMRSRGLRDRLQPSALVGAGVLSAIGLFILGGESLNFGVRLGLSEDLPFFALPIWAALRLLAWVPRWLGLVFIDSSSPERSIARTVAVGMGITGFAGFFFTGQDDGANMFFVLSASGVVSVISAGGLAELMGRADSSDRLRIGLVAMIVGAAGAAWMLRPESVDETLAVFVPNADRVGDAGSSLVVAAVAVVATCVIVRIGQRRTGPTHMGLAAWMLASVPAFALVQVHGGLAALQNWDAVRVRQGEVVWSPEQHSAALWLRNLNTEGSERVVTNRFCEQEHQTPPTCDGPRSERYFWVAAVAGRPMFVEGPVFSFGYGKIPERVVDRVTTSVRFASAPNSSDHQTLWASGVRWVWLDLSQPSATDWDGFGSVAFENEAVRIVRLVPPGA